MDTEGFSDEHSAQFRDHLRDNTNIKDDTHVPATHSCILNNADMLRMIMMAKYLGTFVGLKLPDICLTGEENLEKTSPRKFVPTGDRTQAR